MQRDHAFSEQFFVVVFLYLEILGIFSDSKRYSAVSIKLYF